MRVPRPMRALGPDNGAGLHLRPVLQHRRRIDGGRAGLGSLHPHAFGIEQRQSLSETQIRRLGAQRQRALRHAIRQCRHDQAGAGTRAFQQRQIFSVVDERQFVGTRLQQAA